MTERFMKGEDGGEIELENTSNALRVFAEAGVPIARQRVAGDVFPWMSRRWNAPHRGGYRRYRSESVALAEENKGPPSPEELDEWWQRFCTLYERLYAHCRRRRYQVGDAPL